MKVHLLSILLLLTAQIVAAECYSAGDTRLEFDPKKGAFQLTAPGAPSAFTCDRLWDIRFFDEAARKANVRPADEFNIGCNEHFVQSKVGLDRARAKLQGVRFDRNTGVFTAEYRHPDADVKLLIRLKRDSAELQLEVTNRGKLPISSIYPLPGLEFRLGDRKMILPMGEFSGIEADGCLNCYYWSSSSTWNGILLASPNGSVFALDVIPDHARRSDPVMSHIDGDAGTGKIIRFTTEYVCWIKEGETRRTPVIQLQGFSGLRSWADHYIAGCFPEGMKKLAEKYSPDLWERLRHASWAAGDGKIAELLQTVAATPGRVLLQNGNYMRPLQGSGAKWQLDSFPNYFPVNPYFGTDAEYGQLIRQVVANGGIYVPRTSFFYWVKGSDFDLAHDLRKSAIVGVDGSPRTARWGDKPGYIVSPSDPKAAEFMAETAKKFKSLGAAGYFTNVICAVNVHSIRYDFHPDAPAPDLLYSQIDRMFQRHGDGVPLFCEGTGGLQLFPHLAGVCWDMRYNRDDPANITAHAKWLVSPRIAWAPGLMLTHEYVTNLPHNLNTKDATTTILRLTHSLLNGFLLKVGLGPKQQLSRRNLLWIRACAVLSQELTSRLIGRRLLSYEEKGDVVTADYSGSIVTANFSDGGIPWEAGGNRGVIAPDGFGFRNDAEGVAAGYFQELNGVKFAAPLLLLAVRQPSGATRLHVPLEAGPVRLVWNGAAVEIPAYTPRLERTVPGVTLAADGKCAADPDGAGFSPARCKTGFDAPPPAPRAGTVPLLIDWDHAKPLPPELKLTAPAAVTPEGIRLAGKNGTATFHAPAPFTRRFHAELVIRYDRMPGIPDYVGLAPFVTARLPAGRYYWSNRTVEFGYALKADEFFLGNIIGSTGRVFWTTLPGIIIEPGKFYHVRLTVDGGKQTLAVNGMEQTIPFSGTMRPTPTEWQFGGPFDHMTISMIRFGGE